MLIEWWQHFQYQFTVGWLEHWEAWAIFGLYLFVTWVAVRFARRILVGLAARIFERSKTTLDDRLLTAAVGPLRIVTWALGVRLGLQSLGERIPNLGDSVEFGWVERIAVAVVIVAVAILVNGLVKAALDWYLHELAVGNAATWDVEVMPIARRVASLVIFFIALTIVLQHFDQDITALVTTAGVASLAVALSAQDLLSNMLGGFTILVDRPFKVGDVIELSDGKVGSVIEIGLRTTRLRQFDGNALIMPNRDMANSRVVNYNLPTPQAAIRQTIGVDYGVDIEHAKTVLKAIIEQHPEVLKDPAPGVWFTKFGESALDLFFVAWVDSFTNRFRVTDELNITILRRFREEQIGIPFPQRDLHIKSDARPPA